MMIAITILVGVVAFLTGSVDIAYFMVGVSVGMWVNDYE